MQFTLYDILGFLSAATVLLSLGGIVSQIRLILRRKALFALGELGGDRPTEVLSLNRFSASFIAFFSMFAYGMTMSHMNGYIAFPRAVAVVLLLWILYEIQADRQTTSARVVFWVCMTFMVSVLIFVTTPYRSVLTQAGVAQGVIVVSCLIFAQGVVHQILEIRKKGRTGALSQKMYVMFFIKDCVSISFAFMLGMEEGWPFFLMHFVSWIAQAATLYHFWWAQRSPIAASRRGMAAV